MAIAWWFFKDENPGPLWGVTGFGPQKQPDTNNDGSEPAPIWCSNKTGDGKKHFHEVVGGVEQKEIVVLM